MAVVQYSPPANLALRLLTEETKVQEGHSENSSRLAWAMPYLRLRNTLLLTTPWQSKNDTLPEVNELPLHGLHGFLCIVWQHQLLPITFLYKPSIRTLEIPLITSVRSSNLCGSLTPVQDSMV